MELVPLSAVLGAEVRGLDLAADLTADTVARLHDALDEHALLAFRGSPVSLETQLRLCEGLGVPIDEHQDGTRWFTVSNQGEARRKPRGPQGRLLFHSDFAYCDTLLAGICLYATELPPGGTSTRFARVTAAWPALPEPRRDELSRRDAVHVLERSSDGFETPARRAGAGADDLRARHPAVLEHPRTGEPLPYVNELFTERIDGLTPDESDRLLDDVLAVLYDDRHCYEHRWRLHDLVVWDNLALQHCRPAEATEGTRALRRVAYTSAGDAAAMDRWLAARAS